MTWKSNERKPRSHPRTAFGGGRWWCWVTTRPRAARERACGEEHVGQHVKIQPRHWRNRDLTLHRWCECGARGARLTHSQTATPGSEHSSKSKVAKRVTGRREQRAAHNNGKTEETAETNIGTLKKTIGTMKNYRNIRKFSETLTRFQKR